MLLWLHGATNGRLENIARHKIAMYFMLGQYGETLDFDKEIAPCGVTGWIRAVVEGK